jgi:poly(A) polymerase
MSHALELARGELAGSQAWVVGGAARDRVLGRHSDDLDLVLDGDVALAARALARGTSAAAFELSDQFGSWRVTARRERWQIDLNPLRGGSLEADLGLRDFTINALAEPLAGGPVIDPLGGLADLAAGRLRAVGRESFAADPLRVLRLVRLAVELGMHAEPQTLAWAHQAALALGGVAQERIFAELRRIVAADDVVAGMALMHELGATAVVLPELETLRGVTQNRFHHLDVYGHTLEVLGGVVALERDPAALLGDDHAGALAALLAEPLADELTRGTALRLGALLHDVAKPPTRGQLPDGGVSFLGHDVEGARMAREMLTRLRTSERLRAHVSGLVRQHLRLGFLVHRQPLSGYARFQYMRACEPVQVDVTLLSVADRVATLGDGAERAISAHLELARDLLADTLRWRAEGAPTPLLRGDELSRELGIAPGAELGRLLELIVAGQYAGEVQTRDQALALARGQAQQPDMLER